MTTLRTAHFAAAFSVGALAALTLVGCVSDEDWVDHDHPPMFDEETDIAYHRCLKDNMAAAVAWEAIEEMCRKEAEATREYEARD